MEGHNLTTAFCPFLRFSFTIIC